jgi:hypothetical protein
MHRCIVAVLDLWIAGVRVSRYHILGCWNDATSATKILVDTANVNATSVRAMGTIRHVWEQCRTITSSRAEANVSTVLERKEKELG